MQHSFRMRQICSRHWSFTTVSTTKVKCVKSKVCTPRTAALYKSCNETNFSKECTMEKQKKIYHQNEARKFSSKIQRAARGLPFCPRENICQNQKRAKRENEIQIQKVPLRVYMRLISTRKAQQHDMYFENATHAVCASMK